MGLIKMDKIRENAPIILNVVKDSGWCFTWGIVSVVAVIPVITFQVYEIWKYRKDGTQKLMQNITATIALIGNCTWMISDIFFHDRYRVYSKWIFGISLIFLAAYSVFVYRQSKDEQKTERRRVLMVSKQTRSLVFMHTRQQLHRKPGTVGHRVLMARPKNK